MWRVVTGALFPHKLIYLDESGDLGWKLDMPFGAGGSSRHLTISALCVPEAKRAIPKRVVREMYRKFAWATSAEKKWSKMDASERNAYARAIRAMCDAHPDIGIYAIVVKKENVQQHIRSDGNKLYNYMVKLALLKAMTKCENVTLIPDPRSIKVKSGNSMSDYLQTELWFTEGVATELRCCPTDSARCLAIQFCDVLAGIVQSRFEMAADGNYNLISPRLTLKQLFF